MTMRNSAGGSRPVRNRVLPVSPGGMLSKASQETRMWRATRVPSETAMSWASAPPVVVADEYDVAKIELFDESFDESRQRGEGESEFGWSGLAVGSHRQRWDDAAMVGAEVLDHRRPECFVHEQPMQEHDHGTGGARCDVLNRASFDNDLIHARTRPFAKLERSGTSCATVRRNAISAVTHSSNDSRNGA